MAARQLLRQTSAGAITLQQFIEHFQQAWSDPLLSKKLEQPIPQRLGLAVSGGPDSMALAYLCKELEKSRLVGDLSVTAFVVDHKVREESSREAKTVSSWLEDLGITTEILELGWSKVPSRFETTARKLRFQALGRACRDRGIQTLLLGHHQDDNVETVITRMMLGATGPALSGMVHSTNLPECDWIYGVSQSGSSFSLRRSGMAPSSLPRIGIHPLLRQIESLPQIPATRENEILKYLPKEPQIATGGVLACRPFLSFTKANILATCEENNIPSVTDPTNFDPTLTTRNTIRSLLASDQLPRALQTTSILSLIRSKRKYIQGRTLLSDKLLEKCRIIDLNLHGGWLVIKFPASDELPGHLYADTADPALSTELPSTSETTEMSQSQFHPSLHVKSFTLRRIADLIAPRMKSKTTLPTFNWFTQFLFPSLESKSSVSPAEHQKQSKRRPAFTVGGVMFKPVTWKKSRPSKSPSPVVNKTHDENPGNSNPVSHTNAKSNAGPEPEPEPDPESGVEVDTNSNENIYILTRPPFMRHPHPPQPLPFYISVPRHPPLPANQSPSYHSEWKIWDYRFWIRINITPVETTPFSPTSTLTESLSESVIQDRDNSITFPISVRPFQSEDLDHVVNRVAGHFTLGAESEARVAGFMNYLNVIAPGVLRYTLPMITVDTGDGEQAVGFPTLHYRVSPKEYDFQLGGRQWKIGWEWKYKEIDTEVLQLMGW
ncbi:PP-loop family [Aspergillus sclerotialis]|uniref:tRNA(Ile)-lysidine synthetase n=1 Tax=Aspergillus sclerotialis TaxID=2070753 RepID=A0A3A3A2I0_9EURO|nr:PP-loop family [Aspergillus sclerotialis]